MKTVHFLHFAFVFVGSLLMLVKGRIVPDSLREFYNQVKVLPLVP